MTEFFCFVCVCVCLRLSLSLSLSLSLCMYVCLWWLSSPLSVVLIAWAFEQLLIWRRRLAMEDAVSTSQGLQRWDSGCSVWGLVQKSWLRGLQYRCLSRRAMFRERSHGIWNLKLS